MKVKIVIWALIFSLLGAYSYQVLFNPLDSRPPVAHASTIHQTQDTQSTVFKGIIERLSLKQQEHQEICNTQSGTAAMIHCQVSNIFSQVIFAFTAHVS